jgi:hypothetical protein
LQPLIFKYCTERGEKDFSNSHRWKGLGNCFSIRKPPLFGLKFRLPVW